MTRYCAKMIATFTTASTYLKPWSQGQHNILQDSESPRFLGQLCMYQNLSMQNRFYHFPLGCWRFSYFSTWTELGIRGYNWYLLTCTVVLSMAYSHHNKLPGEKCCAQFKHICPSHASYPENGAWCHIYVSYKSVQQPFYSTYLCI